MRLLLLLALALSVIPTNASACRGRSRFRNRTCITDEAPTVPTTTTVNTTTFTSTTATLRGSTNSHHLATTAWFRYDTSNPGTCDDSFGTRVPAVSGGSTIQPGSETEGFTQVVTGLTEFTLYYYCAISENSLGKTYGDVKTVTPDGAYYRLLHTIGTTCNGADVTSTTGDSVAVTRASSGYCENSATSLTLVTSNKPRLSYKGLIAEPAATNILLQSAAFNTTWATDAATLVAPVVTANQDDAPDTTHTADKVDYPDTVLGLGRSIIKQTVTTTANPYTLSYYAKSTAGTPTLYSYVNDGSFHTGTCVLNSTTYTRCVVTTSALVAGTSTVAIGYNFADGGETGQSGAISVYLWGAQLEQSAYVTSLVATTTAAATRAADRIVAQYQHPTGYVCDSGQVSFKITPRGVSTPFVGTTGDYTFLDTRDTSVNGIFVLHVSHYVAFGASGPADGSFDTADDTSPIFTAGTTATLLGSWQIGAKPLKKDGVEILNDAETDPTVFPAVCSSSFTIGSLGSASSGFANAAIYDIGFYNTP